MIKVLRKLFFYDYILKLKPLWVSHVIALVTYLCETVVLLYCYEAKTEVPNFWLNFIFGNFVTIPFAGIGIISIIVIYSLVKLIFQKKFETRNEFILRNNFYNYFWLIGILGSGVILILTSLYTALAIIARIS